MRLNRTLPCFDFMDVIMGDIPSLGVLDMYDRTRLIPQYWNTYHTNMDPRMESGPILIRRG